MSEDTNSRRTYVVLREQELFGPEVDDPDGEGATTREIVKAWVFVENNDANRPEQAIRTVAEKYEQGGTYVAVPARNFDPVPVEMERTPRAKVGKTA